MEEVTCVAPVDAPTKVSEFDYKYFVVNVAAGRSVLVHRFIDNLDLIPLTTPETAIKF